MDICAVKGTEYDIDIISVAQETVYDIDIIVVAQETV